MHRVGRSRDTDLDLLCDATSFLRTNPPLEAGEGLQHKIVGSADQLGKLTLEITNDPENGNLWRLAQLKLQDLIQFLQKTAHKMKKKLVRE